MIERAIVEAAARLRRQAEPHLVATVVATRGSTYRRPGARMVLTQFRWVCGSVSGGCLEGDISSKGWWRTRGGEPIVVTYDSRVPSDADDDEVRAAFGLGCDGIVEVMLERGGAPGRVDPLQLAYDCARDQRRAAVATIFRSPSAELAVGTRLAVRGGGKAGAGLAEAFGDPIGDDTVRAWMLRDARAALDSGTSCTRAYETAAGLVEVFIEAIVPPPQLFVFGTGHDAVPVVQLARSLGWMTCVCTPRPRVTTRERFIGLADEVVVGAVEEVAARVDGCDRAVAIVMGHDYDLDRRSVAMLLASRVRYIGVLGPRARTERILADLRSDGDPRLHAPLGLELGAETPAEIALAAIAEVQSILQRTGAASLREHTGSIHDHVSIPAAVGAAR